MTYNIEGVPWPIRWGRGAAFATIGERLASMRAGGRQPHIVALQEAFTDDAKAIGRVAGYRHAAYGPGVDQRGAAAATASDRSFAASARWLKGETQGKLVDSGLQILSDYPIVRARRAAFPSFACAGYDCLANKGVLLVSIAVPGAPVPVEILTTHLNSRRASGVSDARSLYAYRRQVEFLGRFVAANHDPASPLIVAGDFNMGPRPTRQSALLADVRRWSNARGRTIVRDGLGSCMTDPATGIAHSLDARWILRRGRDWQFMSDGKNVALTATGAAVPFGRDTSGRMLSDHMGYTVGYRLGTS